MKTFKGTQGEWRVGKTATNPHAINEIWIPLHTKKFSMDINFPPSVKKSEAEANAKLIASAPELLEALQKLAGIEVWISDPEMKKHFQDTLYPAINKALGQ